MKKVSALMQEIRKLNDAIERADTGEFFGAPASERHLREAEISAGFPFPADLRELYGTFDGCVVEHWSGGNKIFQSAWMKSAVTAANDMYGVHPVKIEAHSRFESAAPFGALKIPFGSGPSCYFIIDRDVENEQYAGQVLLFDHRRLRITKCAESLSDFLEKALELMRRTARLQGKTAP